MIQTSKYHWQIVSKSGTIMQTGLFFNSREKAEDYIRAYVSGFTGWGYKMIPS